VYRVRVALVLILIILITLPLFSNAAPPVCGDGSCHPSESCSSCSADCGACPPSDGGGGTTTTTTTTTGGGGPAPIIVSIESPEDGQTMKRGVLTLIVKGYRGTNPETDMIVTATSDLFEGATLTNNFEQRGPGIYGTNVTINKDVKKGNYVILVHGRRESAVDEHQILVTLDPTINVATSIKDSYFKGDRIFFEGEAKYFDGSLAKNSSMEIAIFAPGDYFFNISTASDQNGKFAVSYPISFAEPEGNWDIRITAKDKDGNEGSKLLKTKVSTPEGVVFYTVNFLSPFKDAEFKRGSVVPITVEVKDEGISLEKAAVEFKSPRGELISLAEVRPGVYSLEHVIAADDPLGIWYLSTQAVKSIDGVTKAGGNKIPLVILPAALSLRLLQPTSSDFFIGQQIRIRAELAYADGTGVQNAIVKANLGNESVILLEIEPGIYRADYLFTTKDATATSLQLSGEDIFGNSVISSQEAFSVRQISSFELAVRLFYYNIIARYWYLLVLGIILLVLMVEPFWYTHHLKSNTKKVVGTEERITEIQKETQRSYFKHHTITREEYEELALKYQKQMTELREKKLYLHKKLAKRMFGKENHKSQKKGKRAKHRP